MRWSQGQKYFEVWPLFDRFIITSAPFSFSATTGPYQGILARADVKDTVSHLEAMIDTKTIDWWYDDYHTKGEYEHMASYCGVARAKMLITSRKLLEKQVDKLLKLFKENGLPPEAILWNSEDMLRGMLSR
jgi:hypothetical protein